MASQETSLSFNSATPSLISAKPTTSITPLAGWDFLKIIINNKKRTSGHQLREITSWGGSPPPSVAEGCRGKQDSACVTTRPLCHNPLLPSKANKRLGPLCSSPCRWPRTKCDSRGRSRLLRPGQSPKTQTLAAACHELRRFGGRDAVPSGGGKQDLTQRSPGRG